MTTPSPWLANNMCDAAAFGNLALMEQMLARGARVDEPSLRASGKRPLHYAVENGDSQGALAAIEWLARHGADLDAPSAAGATPLGTAAAFDRAEIALALIKLGANPRGREGDTPPLHWTARRGAIETARVLLDAGADPLAPDPEGNLASDLAQGPLKALLLAAQERAMLREISPQATSGRPASL